jgi:hypothetical protein
MRALLRTYDKEYSVEQETYDALRTRWDEALREDQPTFNFQSRTVAFQGPMPITVPTNSIVAIEAY